ncbi:Adenylosuccinate synthetase [Methanothermus fervidus DSM 2088]|uniref:Adenylosuccinate synthetase n=1 Tax=Methanothermus fervidus (strain ATCC 43054 / DSM 2088 / JCM 10308 / V24 S) TaxID=523846 RepID=E3GW67_METFV|nr:adenylosuccinate synthetase [Methanothermus fervidus]ADP77832.1 Adenylosuccinate synthetase [Methanothermus fervidus DSM 2088]
MTCSVLVGGEWGDEGKGKCITYLCHVDKPDIVARAGVGPNAGHTVEYKGKKYAVRLTPSGFIHKDAKLLIGAGVLIDPEVFLHEMEYLKEYEVDKRTFIDYRCAVIEKKHKELDRKSSHLSEKIGTTGTGCGPANADRVMRKAKLAKQISELSKYLTNVAEEINEAIDNDKDVIIEGSQGFGLSLYYGTYPYVTSKDTTASSAAADVGVGPTKIDEVIVVFKAYATRVGEGPFPTEISQDEAKKMGIVEYGTVTGRPRRVGLFDMELAKESCMINGATQIALTCVDKLYPDCGRVKKYEDLSVEAKRFIERIEEETGVPVTIISTGPDVEDTIDLRKELI